MKVFGLSIQWKILFLVVVGPVIISAVLTWQRIDEIRTGAEKAIISKSAGIVMMAEGLIFVFVCTLLYNLIPSQAPAAGVVALLVKVIGVVAETPSAVSTVDS